VGRVRSAGSRTGRNLPAEAPPMQAAAPARPGGARIASRRACASISRRRSTGSRSWRPTPKAAPQVDVPIADSITTWRISLLASDRDGNLGSADVGLRVFQDFFVEPDLPRFLTVGDEIEVPVSIFNYLDQPQTSR
jgi:CD109 antigen